MSIIALSRFSALLVALTNVALSRANADQIRYLPSGKQALSQLYTDINSAKKSVDMTYFIFEPCSITGKFLVKTLARKIKDDKISVRVLIDGTTQVGTPAGWARMAAFLTKRGIQIRYYNNLIFDQTISWYKQDLNSNFRAHAKLTLVDGEKYISGGRNISDEYYGFRPNWGFIDRDVSVEGPSAQQAQQSFDELWNSRYTFVARHDAVSEQDLEEYDRVCSEDHQWDKDIQHYVSENAEKFVAEIPKYSCASVSYLQDKPHFRDDYSRLEKIRHVNEPLTRKRLALKPVTASVLDIMDRAKDAFYIENWSYIPSWKIENRLEKLRKQKTRIYVFTNNVTDEKDLGPIITHFNERDDSIFKKGSLLFGKLFKPRLQNVMTLSPQGSMTDKWERSPNERQTFILHSKVFMADKRDVLVSSFNLDPRSYHTNIESGVRVNDCPELAAEVYKSMAYLRNVSQKDQSCKECYQPQTFHWKQRLRSWIIKELL